MEDKYVITISREFGSGGRLIGKRLAAKMDIPCYDRTIIKKACERSGLSHEFIEQAEARARSRFQLSAAPTPIGAPAYGSHSIPVSHQAFFAQAEIIRELADSGSCVIVGRCSDYILGDRPECARVFVHADMQTRIRRCIKYYDMPSDGLEVRIKQQDKGRANYYNYYTGQVWGDMRLYDLTINTAAVGIDGAVELIARMIEIRRARAIQKAREAAEQAAQQES